MTETNDAWSLDKLPAERKTYIEKVGHKSLESLIRDNEHLRSMTGADKATVAKIPTQPRAENPGAWRDFDKAIGVPEDGKYGEYKPAKGELGASADQLSKFDAAMHKAGATKDARNAALEAFHALNTEAVEAHYAAMQKAKADGDMALRQAWGRAYGEKNELAKTAVADLDGAKEFDALLKQFQIDDHPAYLRLRAAIGELRAEDGAPDPNDPNNRAGGGKLTPAEANAEIVKKQADPAFWNDRYLKGDQTAVAEMSRLFEMAAASA